MESESQTFALINNWIYFFLIMGGTIYFGVRFSKLALNFGYNRYLFGVIGVVLYGALIRGYNALMTFFPAKGWTYAFAVIAAAVVTTLAIYMLLRNSWQKRQKDY